MELVCKESRRPYTWHFDAETSCYYRKDGKGEKIDLIMGVHLPDPMSILEQRIRFKKEGRLYKDARTHADPVTEKLWEHWNAKLNN